MRRRINHWSSQGFIYLLCRISGNDVRSATEEGRQLPKMHRRDGALGQLLLSLDHNQAIDRIMDYLPPKFGSETSRITNLLAAFEQAAASASGKETPEEIRYNENACVEFHHLLIATLFGYGHALADFNDAKGAGMDRALMQVLEQCALKLWDATHLLWRISHSEIVQYHFWALDKKGFLNTPVAGGKNLYEAAVPFARKKAKEGKETKIANFDTEEDSEFQRLTIHDPRYGQTQYGSQDRYGSPAALAFRRWIRLHVSHFTALNILSTFSFGPGIQCIEDFKISLLSIKHPGPPIRIPRGDWEDVIRNLVSPPVPAEAPRPLADGPFDAQVVIDILNNRINAPDGDTEPSTIIKTFRKKTLISSGAVHCEAALASFVKYASQTKEFEKFDGVIKVRSHLHQSILIDLRYCYTGFGF
jgi:hypothetical protein